MSLIEFYNCATAAEIQAGINWYNLAHAEALKLSDYCKVPIEYTAAVIAVLSPRCQWEVNLDWAWRVIHSYVNHTPIIRGGKCPLEKNVYKAVAILATRDLSLVTGLKVIPFYDNILYPDSSREITIDSWAYRAYLELICITDEVPHKITPKRNLAAADAYRQAAASVGLLPLKFQAIVWIVSHRLEGK
jgi:hypothetical protein